MNIFEKATKNKYRFQTSKGSLNVEQLWDLPLTARGSTTCLDSVAKGIARELRESQEESFVEQKVDRKRSLLENKLELVKHIINSKLAAANKAQRSREISEERQKLLQVLERKQESALENLSESELVARIAELSK